MFGKRCTLCGGKLDSNGICKECGLDNKKNDKNYRVNQSSCDGQPLTHVHTEETKPPAKERMQKASGNKASGGRMQTGPSQSYRPPVYQPAPGSGQKVRKKRPARPRVTGRRSISRLPAADRRCERNGDASDGSASSSW